MHVPGGDSGAVIDQKAARPRHPALRSHRTVSAAARRVGRWCRILSCPTRTTWPAAAIVMLATLAANAAHLARLLAAVRCPPS